MHECFDIAFSLLHVPENIAFRGITAWVGIDEGIAHLSSEEIMEDCLVRRRLGAVEATIGAATVLVLLLILLPLYLFCYKRCC